MAVNLSLDADEAQRLDQIADSITETGNKTEAVRRMMDVFEHSADIACDRAGMETDDSDDIDTSEPLSLEEARDAARRTSSTQEKTEILVAHLDHVSEHKWNRGDLVDIIKSVLDCHRTTTYDYIDRLVATGAITEGPLKQLDIDDVRREIELMDTNMGDGRRRKVQTAEAAGDLVDIDSPDLVESDYSPVYWRKLWTQIGEDDLTYEEGAIVKVAADVAEPTYDEWRDD